VGLKLEDLAADYWQGRFSIGASQPKGCRSRSTSATSRSLWLLAGNFSSRMWSIHGHTHSALFAEIWIASLAPTFLVGYQFASRRRTASQALGARRSLPSPWFARGRSFPPGTGRPSSGPLGDGAGSDGHGALESTSVGRLVVEHKTDGDLSYVMETMSPTNKIWSREAGAAEKRDIISFLLAHLIGLCAFSACRLRQQREAPHSRRGAPSVSQPFR
jgi:hypothetical protein